MKLRYTLLLSALISANVLAQPTGHGFRIIKEESYSSDGRGGMRELPPGVFETIQKLAQKKSLVSASHTITIIMSMDVNAKINELVTLYGYHSFDIVNDTKFEQTYELDVNLECDKAKFYDKRYVIIEPYNEYNDSVQTFIVAQEANAGRYNITASTKLIGAVNHSSKDTEYLTVSK